MTKKLTAQEKLDRKEQRDRLKYLEQMFQNQGGRGVELADEIDYLRSELGR